MAYCGVTPVFADIDPRTYNVTDETVAARITEKTRLVIPVHFAGQPCDMAAIGALAILILIIVNQDILFGPATSFERAAWNVYRRFLYAVAAFYVIHCTGDFTKIAMFMTIPSIGAISTLIILIMPALYTICLHFIEFYRCI